MSPEMIRNLRDAWRWAQRNPLAALASVLCLPAIAVGFALVERSPAAATSLSASLRIATGCVVLFHQVLLEPDRRNYPDGRLRLRVALFAFGVALIYSGGDLLWRLATLPRRAPPQSALLLSGILFVTEGLRLEKVLRSWLPERTQRRIQQLLHLASCRNREAVAMARASSDAAVGRERPRMYPMPARVTDHVVPAALAELALQGSGDRVIGPDEAAPTTLGDGLRATFPLLAMDDDDPLIPAELRAI